MVSIGIATAQVVFTSPLRQARPLPLMVQTSSYATSITLAINTIVFTNFLTSRRCFKHLNCLPPTPSSCGYKQSSTQLFLVQKRQNHLCSICSGSKIMRGRPIVVCLFSCIFILLSGRKLQRCLYVGRYTVSPHPLAVESFQFQGSVC